MPGRNEQAYGCINKMVSNKDVYGKPLLFVLNKVDHGQVDEIEFTNEVSLRQQTNNPSRLIFTTFVPNSASCLMSPM